ncbi:hsp90-like protein [Phlyctema vagabunda]|uniref:Hsp90-like protein n=1 Tax=Phlyctema vagabunda TaxID=108571 RepID=A0ABR4P567_9HELO
MVGSAPSTTEALRLRSVRQYTFARDGRNGPPPLAVSATKNTSSDTALTMFCQLITWRLNVQRAIVSLVGRNDQYFLAESTSTLNLADTSEEDENGASLWMGCTRSMAREHALCANTIKASQAPGRPYPLFWVPDLSKDAAYSHLPYIEGLPHFKFYAGTPLVTRYGQRIGSLFVIDEKPREEGLSNAEQEFLGIMAHNAMNHLDMQRAMVQQKRSTTMSKGLAAFIEGDERIPPSWSPGNESNVRETDLPFQNKRSRAVSNVSSIKGEFGKHVDDSIASKHQDGEYSDTHARVLSRASNLMRESLAVDYTVFFDASLTITADPGLNNSLTPQHGPHSSTINIEDADLNSNPIQTGREGKEECHLAAVLSLSTKENYDRDSQSNGSSIPFRYLEHRFLQHLLRKYSSGVLWSFD